MEPKVCTATLLKAPLHEIQAWVNYHLNTGVDHMFIFFDDPLDKDMKEEIEKNKNTTCFLCNQKYWDKLLSRKDLNDLLQEMRKGKSAFGTSKYLAKIEKPKDMARVEKQKLNSIIAMELAKKKGYNWIAHIDSDELIYTKKPLKHFLEKVPEKFDFIKLPSLEAVPEKNYFDNVFKEINLFKNNLGKLSHLYFRGHIAGKSITRLNEKVLHLGIHRPGAKKGYELKYKHPLISGRLLHFDSPGYENWKQKWLRRHQGKVIAIAMKKKTLKLFNEFVDVYKKGDEEDLKKLYEKQCFISEPLKRFLKIIGILRRINIKKELFKKPKNDK